MSATPQPQLPASLSMLPNPFTPMAFFPPDIAVQLTISIYVTVAATTVSIAVVGVGDSIKLYPLFRF